jgi:hypothetical protein
MTIRSHLALALMGALAMVGAAPAAAPRRRVIIGDEPTKKKPHVNSAPETVREAHPIVPPYTPSRPRAPDFDKLGKNGRRDQRRAARAAKDGSLMKKVTT